MNLLRSFASHDRFRSALFWHFAVVCLLSATLLVLTGRLLLTASFSRSAHERSMQGKKARLAAIASELSPLGSAGKEIANARNGIDAFYAGRMPSSYAQVTRSLGAIAMRAGVSLSHIEYAQGTPGSDLTELSMEIGIGGDYQQVMRFVNGVERDQVFYILRALSFTGQQSGGINVRVRVSTWLKMTPALEPQQSLESPSSPVARLETAQQGGN